MILWFTALLSSILCVWAFCITARGDDPSMCMTLRTTKSRRPSIISFWPPKWNISVFSKATDSRASFLKKIKIFLKFFVRVSFNIPRGKAWWIDHNVFKKGCWSQLGKGNEKNSTLWVLLYCQEKRETKVWKADSQTCALTSRATRGRGGVERGTVRLRRIHRLCPASCLGCS